MSGCRENSVLDERLELTVSPKDGLYVKYKSPSAMPLMKNQADYDPRASKKYKRSLLTGESREDRPKEPALIAKLCLPAPCEATETSPPPHLSGQEDPDCRMFDKR